MDTNMINKSARKMYKKLGQEEVGITDCVFNGIPDVKLVCLEKYLGQEIRGFRLSKYVLIVKCALFS